MNKNILMVDDDENILSSYQRSLKNFFSVTTVTKPEEALVTLKTGGKDFAVIVSDFKMPGMNGIEFLSSAKLLRSDSVRIMLTGYADMQATIDAVNEGNIFRFLTKPCPIDKLIKAIVDGVKQHDLIMAEKELLNKTLLGSIKVLVDILSAVNPTAFSRSMRLCELTTHLGKRLNVDDLWEVEISSLLSQIGCVTIPGEILEKKYQDKPLTLQEIQLFLKHPEFGMGFINNIPRLENVALAISQQFECYNLNSDGKKKEIKLSARLLKVASDYETYLESGKSSTQALFQMHKDAEWYDPDVLAALDAEVSGIEKNYILQTVSASELRDGMRLGENIIDTKGIILLTRGNKINEVIRIKLLNLVALKKIYEPFKILVPVDNIK